MLVCKATGQDIDEIDRMLRCLSSDMQDHHLASIDAVLAAGFGDFPAFHAQIARDGKDQPAIGIALYSPLFSTTIGSAGLYLSDLWVDASQRGGGLGPHLIAAAFEDASTRWQATFVKLAVYSDNSQARRFYKRLGFTPPASDADYLLLKGDALVTLINRIDST